MALVLSNRVQETATANTTVSFTLTGAVSGFQTFATIGNTNTTYYSATDGSGNWEVGLGTYSTTGPTLTRTTVYASSNAGSAVTFSGVVNVFVTYPSGRSVNLDASGNVSALGTVSSGTWQGSTVGVAYGGTGVTASTGANSVVLRDADGNVKGINNVEVGLTLTTSAGATTTLTAASTQIQVLTGTANQTYRLPDATTLQAGAFYTFGNSSSGVLTVANNAGATIETITQGGAAQVLCLSSATVGGTWGFRAFASSNTTWGNAILDYPGTITSAEWNGDTVNPAYGGTGLTTFTGANNALYSTGASTLTAGTLPVAAGGTGQTTYTNGQLLIGNTTGNTLAKATLTQGTGISITNGSGAITVTNSAPDQTVALTGTGATSISGTYPNFTISSVNSGGTVTSVATSGTVSGLTLTGGTITTTGTITLGGTLAVTPSNFASQAANTVLAAPTGSAGVPSFRAIVAADIPTLNQNTTGTAANVTGTVAVSNGGTGQTTYTNGQLLIGNTTGNTLSKATLTQGTGITIANGAGSITVTNSAPDQTVVLTQGGATTITGTYPNFTISSVNTTYSLATSTVLGLIKLGSDTQQTVTANAVSATTARSYALQVNAAGQGVVNVPWTDYTLPAATSTVRGGIELNSDTTQTVAANAVTATASRTYGLQVNADGQGVVNVPWTDYTLPAATSTVRGGIELNSDTAQTVAANSVTATASRTYGLQINADGQGVVNVPWVNTTYSLATSTVAGLIELGSDTQQTVASNAVTATASRSYALQVNADGQGVVNVPWTDTNSGGTVTSVDVSGGTTGLTTSGGPVTTSGTITLAGTLAVTNGGTGATAAAAARTNLGATTLGANVFTVANVAAIAFPRFNADNTVSTLDAASFRTAIGAGTGNGTVTSVATSGTVSGLTLTGGTITTTGTITLGGTLAVGASNFSSQTANTFLAAPNGAAGTPTFRAIVAADVPTLNQNTSGSSGSCVGNSATATTATNVSGGTVSSARINPRTSSVASYPGALTPDVASFDQYNITAQAAGLSISAPIGTPVDGNKLMFRILDNGTARAITWNATYTAIGTTLPTTTVANKMIYVGCIYNSTNARWDVVAVSQQA